MMSKEILLCLFYTIVFLSLRHNAQIVLTDEVRNN
jgi:hypothetical protein